MTTLRQVRRLEALEARAPWGGPGPVMRFLPRIAKECGVSEADLIAEAHRIAAATAGMTEREGTAWVAAEVGVTVEELEANCAANRATLARWEREGKRP